MLGQGRASVLMDNAIAEPGGSMQVLILMPKPWWKHSLVIKSLVWRDCIIDAREGFISRVCRHEKGLSDK